jgi:hypothetical protein
MENDLMTSNVPQRDRDNLEKMFGAPAPIIQTRITKETRKLKAAIAQARTDMRHAAISGNERLELTGQILDASREIVKGLVEDEKTRLDAEMERERARLARDREINSTKVDAEIRAASMRFQAMTVDELESAAREMTSNPRQVLPEIVDALSIELRKVGSSWHGDFRKNVAELRLHEPERHTPEGQNIVRYRALLDDTSDGWNIPMVREDGSFEAPTISDVFGGTV